MLRTRRHFASQIIGNNKKCADCGGWFDIEDFHVNKNGRAGRMPYCKPCFSMRQRQAQTRKARAADPARRKVIASYMRWVRSLRKHALHRIAEMKFNERAILKQMKREKPIAPPVYATPGQPGRTEITERDRYENRCVERDAHSARALSQHPVNRA